MNTHITNAKQLELDSARLEAISWVKTMCQDGYYFTFGHPYNEANLDSYHLRNMARDLACGDEFGDNSTDLIEALKSKLSISIAHTQHAGSAS